MLILGLFGVIIVFGFVAVAAGIWQIVTGRRSIVIIVVVLVLALILVALATTTTDVLKDKKSDRGSYQIESRVELKI